MPLNDTRTSPTTRRPPLDGVRVLDLSRVLAGPWCTMVLGDLGAEIVKVENPKGGDDTRHWGPPFTHGESAYYLCANRNKKSVAIDLSTEDGQRAVRELARSADVLVENYKLGGLDKFGLGYASLQAENPSLVYCSISGYGRQSPRAAEPGYDYVIQAEGGLMAVTGEADGEPIKVGVAVADLFTGMAAAQAILAALIARNRDGLGQHIDMALYDCQLSMLANVGSAYLVSGEEPKRYGNGHPTVVPYQTFAARDKRIVVAVGNDRQFRFLCGDLLGRPDLADDPRFVTNAQRVSNRAALVAALTPLFETMTAEHWLTRLREVGVPCGAVRTVGQALEAPETAARGMVAKIAHPTAGELRLVASPLKLGGTPVVAPTAPPLLGQHTDEVLHGAKPG
jgi:crotonobetainyl-CoA:carnitine CoA-transferase CaiB-like acyl-CoA transferase